MVSRAVKGIVVFEDRVAEWAEWEIKENLEMLEYQENMDPKVFKVQKGPKARQDQME